MFKHNCTYKVIKVDDARVHRPQGNDIEAIQIGDQVKIPNEPWAIWKNPSGEWCWAIEETDKYGAHFHTSHLEAI